jgi:hypothetical protein
LILDEKYMIFDITSPQQYFEKVVLPNTEDFLTERNHLSARHAINAAITAYHIIEWMFVFYHKLDPSKIYNANDINSYKRKLKDDGLKNIDLLHDLANFSKHRQLTKPKNDYIKSSRDVGEWGSIGWEDLGGGQINYDYFLVSIEAGNNPVHEIIFENRLKEYVDWWKETFNQDKNASPSLNCD